MIISKEPFINEFKFIWTGIRYNSYLNFFYFQANFLQRYGFQYDYHYDRHMGTIKEFVTNRMFIFWSTKHISTHLKMMKTTIIIISCFHLRKYAIHMSIKKLIWWYRTHLISFPWCIFRTCLQVRVEINVAIKLKTWK